MQSIFRCFGASLWSEQRGGRVETFDGVGRRPRYSDDVLLKLPSQTPEYERETNIWYRDQRAETDIFAKTADQSAGVGNPSNARLIINNNI